MGGGGTGEGCAPVNDGRAFLFYGVMAFCKARMGVARATPPRHTPDHNGPSSSLAALFLESPRTMLTPGDAGVADVQEPGDGA